MTKTHCVHFVGFKDDRYWNAVKIWGRPHYIHRGWDLRACREVDDEDIVVFADIDDSHPQRVQNYNDIDERFL